MSLRKYANAGLAAAGVAAVALSGLAVSGYSVASSPKSTISAVPAAETSASKASSAGATSSASESPAAGGSSSSSAGASNSATPVALKKLPTDRAAHLLVVGDSTSNETTEWVNELGSRLGQSRSTSVRRINQSDLKAYNDPIHYGQGGSTLSILNASAETLPPVNASTIDSLAPEDPDVVLLSVGRKADAASVGSTLQSTIEAIRAAHPEASIAVVLQPQLARADAAALDAVREWATAAGLPTIDVAASFNARGGLSELVDTDGKVTSTGASLWARTVLKTITA